MIFVAPNGDDGAPGSNSQPLRTLTAAQSAAREILAQDPRTNVRVTIASGRYAIPTPIVFTDRDSPSDGYTVTYSGPPDASAVLVGAQPLGGWERVSTTVHRARLPVVSGKARPFYTLYENGARATLARYPNVGYANVAADVGTSGSKTQFMYAEGDIPDAADEATVYVWAGSSGSPPNLKNNNWEPDIIAVSRIERATRSVTLAATALFPIRRGNRYFVQGHRSLIDRPGEFAVDDKEGYVYYYPRTEPIEKQEILAPVVQKILDVRGSPSAVVRNLAFERLTLTMTDIPRQATAYETADPAAIGISNAERIAVRSSHIHQLGGTGVAVRGHALDNVVSGNLIEDVGMDGVNVQGFKPGIAPGTPVDSGRNAILNNSVRRVGQLHGGGRGIRVSASAEDRIENNVVRDGPRMGILVGGVGFDFLRTVPGLGATEQNYRDLVTTRGNVIRFNDVSNVLLDSQDGGGIYVPEAQRTVVESNRVHDIASGIPDGLAAGIYLDDGTDRTTVRNNIVYGISGTGAYPIQVKGIYTEVTNNVVASAGPNAALYSFSCPGCQAFDAAHDHLTVRANIFYAPGGRYVYWWGDWTADRVAEADRNLFYHPGGTYSVRFRFTGRAADSPSLDEWRATYGFDKASVTADPLFVDAARGDYRVREASPALALGFVNIDTSRIGLTPDHPFKR